MKKLNYLLLFAFILGLGVFAGCGGDDDGPDPETPLEQRAKALALSWRTGSVTDESLNEEVEGFDNFVITFTEATISGDVATGSYTSTGDNSSVEALPVSSSFTINANSLGKLVLSSGKEVSIISISSSQLMLSVPGTNVKDAETNFIYDLVPNN